MAQYILVHNNEPMKHFIPCLLLVTTINAFEVPFRRCENLLKLRAAELEERLDQIAQRLDFGDELTSNDPQFSVEVMQVTIETPSPSSSLGIELIEIRGRGLVLVSDVTGAAAQTNLQVGDVISGVVLGAHVKFQTAGYDATIEVIQQARQEFSSEVTLEINRLVDTSI